MVVKETFISRGGTKQVVETPFKDWAMMTQMDLFRVLNEIDDLCVLMTGQEKEAWTDDEFAAYDRIRRKILNRAGSIARLPET